MARLVFSYDEVIAVEALERFAHNMLHNNPLSQNLRDVVSIFNVALGKEDGRLNFTDFTAAPEDSGLRARTDVPEDILRSQVEIEVHVRTIDQVVAEVPSSPISFVKLEREGAEFDAIRGAYKTISTHRPAIIFEFGQQSSEILYDYSKEDFFDFSAGSIISSSPYTVELSAWIRGTRDLLLGMRLLCQMKNADCRIQRYR
jgi:FkbM family methyltransferase